MRKYLPLHGLRVFEAAAHHRSFSKAAEELNLTPTAISHQIRQLEDQLGQPLFRRFPRPITLTPTGESLYPVLRGSFDRISEALEDIQRATDDRPLVISTTTAFASRWLLPRLSKLKAELGLQLDIRASETRANLRDGSIDCAIRYTRDPVTDDEAGLLVTDHYIPVAAQSYMEHFQQNDWSHCELIHYRWKNASISPPDWKKYRTALTQQGADLSQVDFSKGLRFSEESHAIEAAISGQGVALVSDVLIKKEIADGRLVQVSDVSIPGLSFYVVYPANAPRRAVIEAFLLWARDEIMDAEDQLAEI